MEGVLIGIVNRNGRKSVWQLEDNEGFILEDQWGCLEPIKHVECDDFVSCQETAMFMEVESGFERFTVTMEVAA